MKEFEEGYKAFLDDKQMEHCPYQKGTDQRMAWQDGFVEASIDYARTVADGEFDGE